MFGLGRLWSALAIVATSAVVSASEGPFTTTVNPDGSATLVHGCAEGSLAIPPVIDDRVVTAIGDYAFSGCAGLRGVTIPDGVLRIGDFAFTRTTNLLAVVLADSVHTVGKWAFAGCTGLEDVQFGSGLQTIGYAAFEGCRSLGSVRIPSRVGVIEPFAFSGCQSLTRIDVDPVNPTFASLDGVLVEKTPGVLRLYPEGRTGPYQVPGSVKVIGPWAFSGCSGLSGVTLPEGLRVVGYQAFANCSLLESIEIPGSVVEVGYIAFGGCKSLAEIKVHPKNGRYASVEGVLLDKKLETLWAFPGGKGGDYSLPSTVTNIQPWAFMRCGAVRSVVIPDGVSAIGNLAFSECTNLVSLDLPGSLRSIGFQAFWGCSSLTNVSWPGNVNRIEESTFAYCSRLETLALPEGIREIGQQAFLGCESLTTLELRHGITNIGLQAFAQCKNLRRVTIPASVSSLGEGAFANCHALREVSFEGDAPHALWGTLFQASPTTVYFQPGTLGWKSIQAGWEMLPWSRPWPLILARPPLFGLGPGGFGFIISWATNRPFVVETSLDPSDTEWVPVWTNVPTEGTAFFSDPSWKAHSARFYRVQGISAPVLP